MFTILRTESSNPGFIALVKLLDVYLAQKDGDEHPFYAQYNKLDNIQHAVVAYKNGLFVGCGAIKEYAADIMEVKRMFVMPAERGQGIATKILVELEKWAQELGYKKCILETGKRQDEAIELYKKNHYTLVENYGQYAGIENSLCFEKIF